MEKKKRNTKQIIMDEAMKLFSVYGYEAVSIRTIADAVGIGNSALYKHYKSKQGILDAIVDYSKKYFLEISESHMFEIDSLDSMKTACMEMFYFQTHDKWIVMFRKLLLMEQFKNPQMADIYKCFFIRMPIEGQQKIFEQLMENGIMKKGDSHLLAMKLYAPFFLFHTAYYDEKETIEMLEQHVKIFFEENIESDTIRGADGTIAD